MRNVIIVNNAEWIWDKMRYFNQFFTSFSLFYSVMFFWQCINVLRISHTTISIKSSGESFWLDWVPYDAIDSEREETNMPCV